ncbi:hypothetical protein CapIbe_012117 [Capra ibex]
MRCGLRGRAWGYLEDVKVHIPWPSRSMGSNRTRTLRLGAEAPFYWRSCDSSGPWKIGLYAGHFEGFAKDLNTSV